MSTRRRPRAYHPSGFYSRKTTALATVESLGGPVADAYRERRAELVASLGGAESVSAQQAVLIDLAVRAGLQLESVDHYLHRLPCLVDRRHRRLWQVVKDRLALAAHVQSLMRDLGLERKAKPLPTPLEYARQFDEAKAKREAESAAAGSAN